MSFDWSQAERALEVARRFDAGEVKAALAEVLAAHDGKLTRNGALALAERSGWSVRSLYRWASATPAQPPAEDGATFVERLERGGPAAFAFDDLALTMLYMLGGNMSRFRAEVIAAGYEMPSPATLSRRWRELKVQERDGARRGLAGRYENLFYIRHSAKRPDEAWQLDAFSLDLRTLAPKSAADDGGDGDETKTEVSVRGRRWRKVRPQLLLLIDDHARFIPAWALLDHQPTAADTCCLLADGFEVRPADDGSGVLIGGLCERLVTDNDTSFRSQLVEGMLARLPTQFAPAPAYSPHAKGKVERVGATIQRLVVSALAGVVTAAETLDRRDALGVDPRHWLEFSQVEALVAQAIHAYNYETARKELRNRTPFEAYTENRGAPRPVPDDVLAAHYLPIHRDGGRRKLHPSGVKAFDGYWLAAAIDENLIGTTVQVRSLLHRLDRLALFTIPAADGEPPQYLTMVKPSDELSDPEREAVVGERIAQSRAVARYARLARTALRAHTAAVAAGEATSVLRAARNAVEVDTAPPPGTGAAREASPTEPAASGHAGRSKPPVTTAGDTAPTGPPRSRAQSPRPTRRPARQDNSTADLVGVDGPAADGSTDQEAILDAELVRRRNNGKEDPR